MGDEEALVDDAVGGEGGDVEGVLAGEVGGGDGVFDDAADEVETAFEGAVGAVGAGGGCAFRDEALADDGQDAAGGAADGVGVGGDVAPAEEAKAAGGDGVFEAALAPGTLGGVRGEEAHTDAVVAGVGEVDAEAGGLGAEEGVGQLDEDAGAVAGEGVRAEGAAMLEVFEDFDGLLNDGVGALAAEVGDEANAAGVVLECGVVEALRAWGLRPGGAGGGRAVAGGGHGSPSIRTMEPPVGDEHPTTAGVLASG